jgi:hypothetical protein
MNSLPARASDVGPADDPDDGAWDELCDDDDFKKSFCESHAWQLIALLETPDIYPTLLVTKAKRLRDMWYCALWAELKNRRDHT